ncbi:glutathione S-transferase family protein [Devosia sp.]|uniref:glutathione S-transferase family protein n=1 Tax=Devosia sp. TaxID=1871048 RepID=UPI003A959F86
MPTLYDYELSAGCYTVRLMLSILRQPYDAVPVDIFPGVAHLEPEFLELNPLGELPVLVDGDRVLRDAPAILVHLAQTRETGGEWLREADLAEITSWLLMAQRLSASVGQARLIRAGIAQGESAPLEAEAHRLLRVIDEHLWFGERESRDWLVAGGAPTIADIGCFPDIALSEEAGVMRQDYPAVRRWMDRVKRLSGFIGMSGVFPAGPARE